MFSRMDDLRKIMIKSYEEEYFGSNIQIEVVDFEFHIPSVRLDSPMLPSILFYKFWKENSKFLLNLITIKKIL